jgi:hypothetical protein
MRRAKSIVKHHLRFYKFSSKNYDSIELQSIICGTGKDPDGWKAHHLRVLEALRSALFNETPNSSLRRQIQRIIAQFCYRLGAI